VAQSQIERRRYERAVVRLPVHVVDTEGGFEVFEGETVDLSVCGLRAQLQAHMGDRLPTSCETTVQVELPDGGELVAEAIVADGWAIDGGYEYRIVFVALDPEDLARLAAIVSRAAA
jgi:hypothetical protein